MTKMSSATSKIGERNNNLCQGMFYRISRLVLSTAAFTPTALWVLQTHAFIQSLSANSILVKSRRQTLRIGFSVSLVQPFSCSKVWTCFAKICTHPVALIAADKQRNFVCHQVSTRYAAVTPGHQQHSALHSSSNVRVPPPHSVPVWEAENEGKKKLVSGEQINFVDVTVVRSSLVGHLSPEDTHWWQPRW